MPSLEMKRSELGGVGGNAYIHTYKHPSSIYSYILCCFVVVIVLFCCYYCVVVIVFFLFFSKYEYKLTREYNWNVKNKASKGNEVWYSCSS